MDISTISTVIGIFGSLSGTIYLIIFLRDRNIQQLEAKGGNKTGNDTKVKPIVVPPPAVIKPTSKGGQVPMTNDGATEFVNNEQEYQNWLKQHPQGFVVNTHAKPDKRKEYSALHKASCSSISRYSDKITSGAYTERDFIKVCADDVASLVRWTARIGRIGEPFSSVCGLCKPSTPAGSTSPSVQPASTPINNSAPTNMISQSNFWTPNEFAALLERCRALPAAQGNYIINDYVENILLTVLDFQMQTPTVEKAARHYKDRVQFQLNSFFDLQNLLARFPDDQEGNTQIAQYLWGYKLWTRVSLLRRLLKYLEERGITTQEKLKEWAFQSDYNLDVAGKVKGIGFGIYKWLVMRQGVETIKPDIWVHRFLKKSIGRELNDSETVEILEAAAKQIGGKAYELDWRIWESQRLGSLL